MNPEPGIWKRMWATKYAMATLNAEEEDGWFVSQTSQPFWQSFLRRFIASGPVPRHVAFVMDGNRRFAKTRHLGSVIKGHEKGFLQLARILDWCNRFGIQEITVYAFSIENFKRSEDEVSGLMRLAEEKFAKLLNDDKKLEEKRICFRFYGNRALLSARLQQLMTDIEEKTEKYENGRLNVCMPYTSRDEIARSFETIRQKCKQGKVSVDEINESMIDACLDSGCGGSPPDLFIRTSGEHRLSDFLMWQASDTHVYFDDVLWPEFGYYNLCKAILNYQYYRTTVAKISTLTTIDVDNEDTTKWQMNFSGNYRELTSVKS
uniref:Alkyl transferase n=1 Tax=Caenorhabditis japonica TaxID=281687 RepID=A0A8R1ET31_CAEJA